MKRSFNLLRTVLIVLLELFWDKENLHFTTHLKLWQSYERVTVCTQFLEMWIDFWEKL